MFKLPLMKFSIIFFIMVSLIACSKNSDIESSDIFLLAGDINESQNNLLSKSVYLEATIVNTYKCKVPSNKGYICMLLDGSDVTRYELAYANSSKFDANIYEKWHSNKQLLQISGKVELREGSKGEKIPSLVISKMEPLEKHSDLHYKTLNAYFTNKKSITVGSAKSSSPSEKKPMNKWVILDIPTLDPIFKHITKTSINDNLIATKSGKLVAWSRSNLFIETVHQNVGELIVNKDFGLNTLNEFDCSNHTTALIDEYWVNLDDEKEVTHGEQISARNKPFKVMKNSPMEAIYKHVCSNANLNNLEAVNNQLSEFSRLASETINRRTNAEQKAEFDRKNMVTTVSALAYCQHPGAAGDLARTLTELAASSNSYAYVSAITSSTYAQFCSRGGTFKVPSNESKQIGPGEKGQIVYWIYQKGNEAIGFSAKSCHTYGDMHFHPCGDSEH